MNNQSVGSTAGLGVPGEARVEGQVEIYLLQLINGGPV